MALFVYVRAEPSTLRFFIAMLLLAFFKIGLESFIGKLNSSMVWENQGIMRLNGTEGSMFGHPNSLSGFAVCTLPFLYYFFPVVPRKWKLALLVLTVFAANMIIFTGSRAVLQHARLTGLFGLRSSQRSGSSPSHRDRRHRTAVHADQYTARFQSAFVGKEAEESKEGAAES
jgi:hypothetical protein